MPAFVNVKKKRHLPAREKISFSVDGYNVVFISFICADLGAQVENVAADCAGVTIGRRTPEAVSYTHLGIKEGTAAAGVTAGKYRKFKKQAGAGK